jgi:hypothetical protein
MLKIKDNIDLKELEKFGFKKYGNEYSTDFMIGTFVDCWFKVNCLNRILEMKVCSSEDCSVPVEFGCELLFDLIKADLVEKGGEKNES